VAPGRPNRNAIYRKISQLFLALCSERFFDLGRGSTTLTGRYIRYLGLTFPVRFGLRLAGDQHGSHSVNSGFDQFGYLRYRRPGFGASKQERQPKRYWRKQAEYQVSYLHTLQFLLLFCNVRKYYYCFIISYLRLGRSLALPGTLGRNTFSRGQ
jgi:hypothetical protein